MKKLIVLAVVAVGFAALAEKSGSGARPAAAAKKDAITFDEAEVKWGPAPPVLPAGAQLAVLHGDPGKKTLFAVRLKMPDGYKIPAHWHSNDEELTILTGAFELGMGDKPGDAGTHTLGPHAYHYLPAKMHHFAQAKGDTVLELHGMGPFDIHYLNPADDPSKNATATDAKPR
jgi:hypothetical protein